MEQELEFLKKRRSIRRYKTEQISEQQLHDLEEMATLAASAMNEQAWFFVVIQKPEILQELAELSGRSNPFYSAPTLVVAFARNEAVSSVVDTAFAMSNMMNAAVADGLGTCFINVMKDVFNDPRHSELKAACGVPAGFECIGSLAVGYPDEIRTVPTDRRWDVFSYIR
ncbi:MAG: hypothetical protein EOM64_06690 [Erysipelotrichia bacterium]|nr:hypothetical protein [Erysipelotrichia bacterium]